jgi:rhodanese-related sulfurtransferase
VKYVSPSEARALLAAGDVDLVDVREAHEWATGHLPGARLVPLGVLKADPRKAIPRDRVLFVCAKGGRSQTAGQVAEMLGFVEVYSLDGGTEAWAREGLPLERPEGVAPVQETAAPEAPPSDLDVRLPELDVVISANLKELRTGLAPERTSWCTPGAWRWRWTARGTSSTPATPSSSPPTCLTSTSTRGTRSAACTW